MRCAKYNEILYFVLVKLREEIGPGYVRLK